MLPKFAKPAGCLECVLEHKGFGYAPPSGPNNAPILFVGEALGYTEGLAGFPFAGAAGGMFERILKRSHLLRENVRVANCVSCQPPGDWLDGAPWEYSALAQCRQYLNPVLNENHRVIVTLGAIPLRQVLDLWGMDGIRVQDFHATVHQLPSGPWVVPTYHPSHLQRGAINLLDVVRFDLNRAVGVARSGWNPSRVSLLQDPPPHVFALWASGHLERLRQDPEGRWLGVDIETPDKEGGRDEGELNADDVSTQIRRINFSDNPDEGLSVPYEGPYIPLVDQLLAGAGIVLMWNKGYDEPRLRFAGHQKIGREIWDMMWAAHHLQSDLPLGLGFWAPLYSDYSAWKHLGKVKGKEAEYGCVDGFQTVRVGHGIVKDLVEAGLWEAFYRHTHLREQYVLRPAHDIGLLVDLPKLDQFHLDLQAHAGDRLKVIGDHQVVGNLKPKLGYREQPTGPPPKGIIGKHEEKGDHAKAEYIQSNIKLVERDITVSVRVCGSCGKDTSVGPKHNCLVSKRRKKDPAALQAATGSVLPGLERSDPLRQPDIRLEERTVRRWFWQLPFNPDASQQILKFIRDSGEQPGKAKKTRKDTGNKETLKRLAKKTGNPIYTTILEYKAVKKVDSTYAVGAKKRIWTDGRLHPQWTGRPSMGRDSYVSPNIQNVIADKDKSQNLAAGFRECIVASPGCWLLEVDFAGIEGIETGWLSGDPDYIRLAYLGVHAYLASHLIGQPASLSWSDADLSMYFAEIKKSHPFPYDKAKRCVHGNNYGLTIHGMVENFPEVYPDLKAAKVVQDLYYAVAPKLAAFHTRMRDRADHLGRLGGPAVDDYYQLTQTGEYHPYAYRHWFWGVQSLRPMTETDYRKAKYASQKRGESKPRGVIILNGRPFRVYLGEDSKRVIAFYPQSIAAGRLKEAELELFHPESPDFIGDRYYGRTPLRAPIHDSLLMEVPGRELDYVVEQSVGNMRRPEYRQPCPPEWGIGDYLRVGVSAKVGKDWMHMDDIQLPDMLPAEAREPMYLPMEEDQYDEVQDLSTQLSQLTQVTLN